MSRNNSNLSNTSVFTIIVAILVTTISQKCSANKVIRLGLEPFMVLSSNSIIKETYGIGAEVDILSYISIGSSIAQNVINNNYYIENIFNNIIATNKREIILPDRFYHYYYNFNFRIKTPEVLKSRITFNYSKHNSINNSNYELLYISQDMAFFRYETYTLGYEINFKESLLNLYFKQNHIYNNIKDNVEYGIDYSYRFSSNSSFTVGYSYSYDKLKDNFDDRIMVKYLIKDEDYLYFRYNKRVAQISKDLLIRKNVNSLKLTSNFRIDDNIKVIFSLIASIDSYKNKSLFFKFGLGF